ncbi:MAG: asparagine synthase-related protein, partial [Arenicellales bacterium]
DFAFAIWDKPKRQLFCARDILGLKPFHYAFDQKRFVFGSDLRQVAACPGVDLAPNEAIMAEYLANNITSRSGTLHRGISRLPAAHYMIVKPSGLTLEKYWDIDTDNILRYSSDQEYADHFLSIFQKCITSRIDVNRKVGVFLSGGMDSSCVAAMASKILRGQKEKHALYSASLLFDGLSCDETPQIRQAIDTWNTKPLIQQFNAPVPGYFQALVDEWQDFPDYPNLTAYQSLESEASGKGVDIWLSGSGADDWLDIWDAGYPDMIREIALDAMQQHFQTINRQYGLRYASKNAIKQCMLGVLPNSTLEIYRRIRRSPSKSVPMWLDKEFATRVGLATLTKTNRQKAFRYHGQRNLYDWLQHGYLSHFIEAEERVSTREGIESRMPFYDRRIIEFGFSLPPDYKWGRSDRKPVIRHALKKMQRGNQSQGFSRAEGSPMYLAALESLGGLHFFRHLKIAEYGFIDASKVEYIYERMQSLHTADDIRYANLTRPLWMIAGIELWYNRCVN